MSEPLLVIRIKKSADGRSALSCQRRDGSIVYQRQTAAQAGFFTRHDLTHYAVETVLHHRKGFYGLLADGWDFEDFSSKWDKRKYPSDADPSELIVGFFDAEHRGDRPWSAVEFNQFAQQYMEERSGAWNVVLTDEQLRRIREMVADLSKQWDDVEPGETLELLFKP
jgi:hypothetical protein